VLFLKKTFGFVEPITVSGLFRAGLSREVMYL